ncbi:MAG: ATPase [Bacteroidetes bacterium]|nr:MAG: ATPase [Bacteroidota bacterium]PTM11933.1 MAG: ATPase [Bacteroidota bacterium]
MKKVLITGPESSGKTSLAQHLARRFKSPWVGEFARTYLAALDRPYVEEDLLQLVNGQLRLEGQQMGTDFPYLFCDTGPEVIYIWSMVKYGHADPYLKELLHRQHYATRLLCYPDLAWEPDPLREAPALESRLALFGLYQDLHQQMGWDYTIIRGPGEARFLLAENELLALPNE